MVEYFNFEVTKLERTKIMNVDLKGLPIGEWRDLTDEELHGLFKLIENSKSEAPAKKKTTKKSPNKANASKNGNAGKPGGARHKLEGGIVKQKPRRARKPR